MISKSKFPLFGYLLTIFSLFFYTFTQVDLSLTLSKADWWQATQKFFQQIGYFNRPLSAVLYTSLILLMFFFYVLFIRLALNNKVNKKTIWIFIFLTAGILTFSYNAFSYDLFNYIFDAKIFTFYHQNPYAHKALDYMGDPMLSFMHWTHRTYPYGPSWIGLTIPLSFIGLNFFLPTFFMFKGLAAVCYVGISYFIVEILKKVSPKDELSGLVLFALNPLVIIESLISSHNDIAMMLFSIAAVYFLLVNKKSFSLISLLFSIGIKFATVFLAPVFIFFLFKKDTRRFLSSLFICMFVPLILVSIRTNFQPWYLLYIIPFAGLIPKKSYAVSACIILPFFALAQYLPYIYQGDWNGSISQILLGLTISGVILYVVYVGHRVLPRLIGRW